MAVKNRTRRQFSDEFKREAVSLIAEQGFSFEQAAESLGVKEEYLRRWKKQYDAGSAPDPLSTSEREELLRLRKENKQLQMEREILKKANAFFAKEMN